MRIRRKKGTKEELFNLSPPFLKEPEKFKGKWREYFKNNNPIHLELGIGKGMFINTLAQKNSHINFIGIDLIEEFLLNGVKKSVEQNIKNIAYIWTDVKNLNKLFAQNEVERIYINFCDPWPKKKHAKRRLTHNNFLALYKEILVPNAEIHFKTDHKGLFEFSLNEFCTHNWKLKNISLDLYKNLPEDNVPTEYELNFVEQKINIYRLEAINKIC